MPALTSFRNVLGVAALMAAAGVRADIYMQNPLGANDRNCERNVNRNNGNRIYDTQNNAKGGYACHRPTAGPEFEAANGGTAGTPKMTYYSGSKIPIEWTAQHGCGENSDVDCQVVIQFACEDTLDPANKYASGSYVGAPRDGIPRDINDAATDRIPDNEESAKANTIETRRFGMHESFDYYQDCQTRQRNKGLFAADQKLKRRDARATRQNPNGNRNGFECPEERDHYPYWHPTPWRDIAVAVSNYSPEKVAFYQANSENAVARGYCQQGNGADAAEDAQKKKQRREWYNNKAACEAAGHQWSSMSWKTGNDAAGVFKSWANGPGTQTPNVDVVRAQFSRTNHLGHVAATPSDAAVSKDDNFPEGANPSRYYWTVPDMGANGMQACVLRIRYNISTSDYDAWKNGDHPSSMNNNIKFDGAPGMNSTYNGKEKSPVTQDPYTYFGAQGSKQFLSMAVNTNQYGRTFQDRSHVFSIKRRPANVPNNANIINLNVEGKRGNIVQTYPAVEYHFVPDDIKANKNDYLHIQWTGSDYNPRRGCNNGEGGPPDPPTSVEAAKKNSRADRSNIVMMAMGSDNVPSFFEHNKQRDGTAGTIYDASTSMFSSEAEARKFAFLDQPQASCLTEQELNAIGNKNQRENHPFNCAKLNAQKTPYFKGDMVQLSKGGKFSYFSSRNNNFSNRDQTGHVCVVGDGNNCAKNENNMVTEKAGWHNSVGVPIGPPEADETPTEGETAALQERENDSIGDGDEKSCDAIDYNSMGGINFAGAAAIGIGCVVIGVVGTVLAVMGQKKLGYQPESQWMSKAGDTA